MADIPGTTGPDDLEGTGQDDTINGLGGDDVIRGRRGNDTIDGGDGRDIISFRGEGVTSGIRIDFNTGTASDGHGTTDQFVNIEGVVGTDFDDVMIGSDRSEAFAGRGGNDTVNAGGGNDRIGSSGGNDQIDGGAGTDTIVFEHARSAVTINRDASGRPASIISPQGQDTVVNVERVEFIDGTLAFDTGVGETAGAVYRFYLTVFDRAPDVAGLTYWIAAMDAGKSILDVAANFVDSDEFDSLYGVDPSAETYVAKLYQNILGREGDAQGVAYWEGQLEAGATRAQVLFGFSEGPEYVAGVAPILADGVFYGIA